MGQLHTKEYISECSPMTTKRDQKRRKVSVAIVLILATFLVIFPLTYLFLSDLSLFEWLFQRFGKGQSQQSAVVTSTSTTSTSNSPTTSSLSPKFAKLKFDKFRKFVSHFLEETAKINFRSTKHGCRKGKKFF